MTSPFPLSLRLSLLDVPPKEPFALLWQPAAQGNAILLEAMPDGGLRFAVRVQHPGSFTEGQVQGVEGHRKHFAHLPYWRHAGDPVKGLLFLCAPGFMIPRGQDFTLELRYDGIVLSLYLENVLVDEDWPYGEIPAPHGPVETRDAGGFRVRIIEANAGQPHPSPAQVDKILGPDRPFGQYWAPRGHNTSAGDVMLCFDEKRLHVVYLNDRRNHGSRWCNGACSFEHVSTGDLKNWETHPPFFSLQSQAETAVGTGCMIFHEGKYYAWGNYLSERMGETAIKVFPNGLYRATSTDGLHFVRDSSGPDLKPPCEPGIWFEKETGIFHLVRAGQRMESRDLKNWQVADAALLPPPAGIHNPNNLPTVECYTVFQWNGWFYALGGRTGFWMARDIRGPFWPGADGKTPSLSPRWDIYDGLMVPQMAVVWDNRCILCGWVVDEWWGGNIVFRELIQYEDGTLGLTWVPELQPRHAQLQALPETDSQVSRTLEAQEESFQWKSFHLPREDFFLKLRLRPSSGTQAFGINLQSAPGYSGGAELRFEPGSAAMQWGTEGDGCLAKPAKNPREWAIDFVVPNVEGLHDVTVELYVRGTIIDACINGNRTIITRRHHCSGNLLHIFVKGGSLDFSVPEAAPLID